MPSLSTFGLFAIAALVLLLIPGPAVLYITARGIQQGRRAGLLSAAGVGIGNLFQVMAATLGLSALILSSAVAFSAVKYAGAAYLIYLGIRTLLTRDRSVAIPSPAKERLGRIFGQGIVVSTLNPKTALFFLAFLPQFVDRSRGAVPEQVLLLGILFVAIGVCTDGLYGFLSGTIGGWLRAHVGFFRLQRYVSGTIYIGLGLTTALAGANRK